MRREIFTFSLFVCLCVSFLSLLVRQNGRFYPVSALGSHALYLPVIANRHDPGLGTPLFGVQTYQSTNTNDPYHPFLVDSGTTWIRLPVAWSSVEPVNTEPTNFYWSTIDNMFAGALPQAGGFKLIATISTSPEWAAEDGDGVINSANLDDFAQFLFALAERYDGDGVNDAPNSPVVIYWEMFNEPDNNSDRSLPTFREPAHWGDHALQYAEMLSFAYPAIKSANPQAQIVFGGVAHDWFVEDNGPFVRSFINDVLAAGGGGYFDIMNFHYYPAFKANWTDSEGPGLAAKTYAIRNILEDHGIEKPIIITESGWHDNNSPGNPSTPEIQSRYVVELFVQSIAADVDVMIWWMLYDPGGFYPYNTGLLTNATQPDPKPSYDAFRLLVSQLSTAHLIRILPTQETGNSNLEVYEFNDHVNNRTLYVAWLDPVDTTLTAPVHLPASQATVIDSRTGGGVIIVDGADGALDGYITVEIGGRPVYIEVSQ